MHDLDELLVYFARKGLLDEGEERVIGENSSSCWEVKVAFDGFGGENDDDENLESYVIYIRKDASSETYLSFPPHETNGFHVIHRPSEEAYVYFWYDVVSDEIEIVNFEDTIFESSLTAQEVQNILSVIYERYVDED